MGEGVKRWSSAAFCHASMHGDAGVLHCLIDRVAGGEEDNGGEGEGWGRGGGGGALGFINVSTRRGPCPLITSIDCELIGAPIDTNLL